LDWSEALSGLLVSGCDAIDGVNTDEVRAVGVALYECAVLAGARRIVGTSDTVIDVLAILGGITTLWVANLDAERVAAHKVSPLLNLGEAVIVRVSFRVGVGVHESAERVSTSIGAVRVKLATEIVPRDVNKFLVDEASDLKVVRSLSELHTGERAARNNACSAARLRTPGDLSSFAFTYGRTHLRGP